MKFILTILKLNHTLGHHQLENQVLDLQPNIDELPKFDNSWHIFYAVTPVSIDAEGLNNAQGITNLGNPDDSAVPKAKKSLKSK